jgi:hypothetical protein
MITGATPTGDVIGTAVTLATELLAVLLSPPLMLAAKPLAVLLGRR